MELTFTTANEPPKEFALACAEPILDDTDPVLWVAISRLMRCKQLRVTGVVNTETKAYLMARPMKEKEMGCKGGRKKGGRKGGKRK